MAKWLDNWWVVYTIAVLAFLAWAHILTVQWAIVLGLAFIYADLRTNVEFCEEEVPEADVHCRECGRIVRWEDPHAVSTPVGPDYYCEDCCPVCNLGGDHADGG